MPRPRQPPQTGRSFHIITGTWCAFRRDELRPFLTAHRISTRFTTRCPDLQQSCHTKPGDLGLEAASGIALPGSPGEDEQERVMGSHRRVLQPSTALGCIGEG